MSNFVDTPGGGPVTLLILYGDLTGSGISLTQAAPSIELHNNQPIMNDIKSRLVDIFILSYLYPFQPNENAMLDFLWPENWELRLLADLRLHPLSFNRCPGPKNTEILTYDRLDHYSYGVLSPGEVNDCSNKVRFSLFTGEVTINYEYDRNNLILVTFDANGIPIRTEELRKLGE